MEMLRVSWNKFLVPEVTGRSYHNNELIGGMEFAKTKYLNVKMTGGCDR